MSDSKPNKFEINEELFRPVDISKLPKTYTLKCEPLAVGSPTTPTYKWDEPRILAETLEYINTTYSGHYASGEKQATEQIDDAGHGIGFMCGNVAKYALRYGKKAGYNKKDLLKALHYAVMALYIHERDHEPTKR